MSQKRVEMSQKRVEISQKSRNEQCNEQDSRGGVDMKINGDGGHCKVRMNMKGGVRGSR